ncbi:MAG: zinc transporter ZupT [Bdellovibrionota bacterium]
MFDNFWTAFGLSVFAGLATGIGGLVSVFKKTESKKFLSLSLGFSAGVMIYISFVELFAQSLRDMTALNGKLLGTLYTNLAFFGGIALIALIDSLVPSFENPHEIPGDNASGKTLEDAYRILRMSIMSMIAIAIHNFPEGMATFVASLKNVELGTSIAVAIGIHNIPEGIAIAVPVYMATRSRVKAISFAFVAGLCEPIGALFAFGVMRFYWNDQLLGLLFAAVAGIMVFISLDQLLPHAERYGHHHYSIYGLVGGMVVMATSLLLVA